MAGEGDDEEIVTGTEGEDATGSDGAGRDDESEVSAEHADEQEDDGEQEVAEEAAAKPSRGESRIQRLANEARQAAQSRNPATSVDWVAPRSRKRDIERPPITPPAWMSTAPRSEAAELQPDCSRIVGSQLTST